MARCAVLFALIVLPSLLGAAEGALPAPWSVAPFALLLIAIAVGPLLAPHLWHRWYPSIATGLGGLVAGYYLFELHKPAALVHVGFEYATFIALLGCLYLCSGGIVVRINRVGTAWSNLAVLLGGACAANLIGTTGASLLLIRPFMAMNRGRLRPYHVVFFIFMVSNCGGCLTPIGDPPLLLGFLRGIAFFHFFELAFLPWLLTIGLLSAAFLAYDLRNRQSAEFSPDGKILTVAGKLNIALLLLAIGCIFIDPAKVSWLPAITFQGERFSFVRELLMGAIGYAGWKLATPERHKANDFLLGPIQEVALLFIGIFLTMLPALELIRHAATSGALFGIPLTPMTYYLGTGIFSAVLDNAPTFLAFLAGLQGQTGLDIAQLGHSTDPVIVASLTGCLTAAVFWGAMSYIGNGPNFMVKAIVESSRDQAGQPLVEMPSFFGYILRYSMPILLPILLIVGFMFYL